MTGGPTAVADQSLAVRLGLTGLIALAFRSVDERTQPNYLLGHQLQRQYILCLAQQGTQLAVTFAPRIGMSCDLAIYTQRDRCIILKQLCVHKAGLAGIHSEACDASSLEKSSSRKSTHN